MSVKCSKSGSCNCAEECTHGVDHEEGAACTAGNKGWCCTAKCISPEKVRTIQAANFVGTVAANIDNHKMSNKVFRDFIRRTLPIVIYDPGRLPMYGDEQGG